MSVRLEIMDGGDVELMYYCGKARFLRYPTIQKAIVSARKLLQDELSQWKKLEGDRDNGKGGENEG